MDKETDDKPKVQEDRRQDASSKNVAADPKALASGVADFSKENVGAYNPDLTQEAWEHKLALKDTVRGRGLIRMFSRGVMGASAFAVGGIIAGKQMADYAPDVKLNLFKKPLHGIARFFDIAFGKPLKGAVNRLGRDGNKFVNDFRPTLMLPAYKGKMGRSLGHEVVMVTFDFASMSIGDFWGRKIMHTLDPNKQRPAWKREDGSIDWAQAVRTFAHNWWTAVTYSAGEDWAVAVPYVLTMRHIGTPIVDKIIPGYRYDFDLNGNGGGIKIDSLGHIRGNFTTAGVINLWERFTTYNVGTLMFRETYNWVGNRIKHWWKTGQIPSLVEADPQHPHRSAGALVFDGTTQFINWVTRSTIKAVTYMIPAVPFFWITRVPQHKFKGAFIHPEKGPLVYYKEGKPNVVHFTTMHSPLHPDTRFTNHDFTANTPVFFNLSKERTVNPFSHGPIDPHARTWGPVDAALNPIAKATVKVRETLRKPVGRAFGLFSGYDEGKKRAGTYINASMAYTPYFFMKSDYLADKWDTGWMDVALDRTIKGALTFNPGEFTAGVGEVWHALRNKPFDDPIREQYAECRDITKETPSDNKFDINPNAGGSCNFLLQQPSKDSTGSYINRESQVIAEKIKQQKLDWRERIVAGKKEDRPEINANKPTTYAEQEEMRKALEELHPPTNSIN